MPLPNRHLTSMLLRCGGKMVLVDCGEGTQVSLRQLGWGFKEIGQICITHFHADHIAGLPGLLLTISNSGRTEPLKIVGPQGIGVIVNCLCCIVPRLPFHIEFIELPFKKGEEVHFQADGLECAALPLDHRGACFGYRFDLPRTGKFDPEQAKALDIPLPLWSKLQKGETVSFENNCFTPDMVMGPARKGIRVSYMTDTRPTPQTPEFVAESDLFICEGMYGDNEKLEKVTEYKHMLYAEAAELASKGKVKELWLTHFSPAMTDPSEFLEQTKLIFPNTTVGEDRMTTSLNFINE